MRGGITNRNRPNHDPATLQAWSDRLVAGETIADLIKETGHSRKAIYGALRRRKLPMGKLSPYHVWSAKEFKHAQKLYLQGNTAIQVAEKMGMPKQSVDRLFRRQGFRMQEIAVKRRTDPKTPLLIYSMRKQGMKFLDIAVKLGWPATEHSAHRASARLYRYCARAGVIVPSADKPPAPKPPKAPRTSSTSTTVTSTRRFCERAALFVSG